MSSPRAAADGKSSPTASGAAISIRAVTTTTPVGNPHTKGLFFANAFSLWLLLWQAALIALFASCATFAGAYAPGGAPAPPPARFALWMDTHTSACTTLARGPTRATLTLLAPHTPQ